jgi:hypothetical protein
VNGSPHAGYSSIATAQCVLNRFSRDGWAALRQTVDAMPAFIRRRLD